jgi:hypothetical protein
MCVHSRINALQALLEGSKAVLSVDDFGAGGALKSSREIEDSFCPSDLAAKQEASRALDKEYAALEFNYNEMQKKALRVESAKERARRIEELVVAGVCTRRTLTRCLSHGL